MRARVPPLVLVAVGLALSFGLGNAWFGPDRTAAVPWWAYLFLILMAVAMAALAGAVTVNPRPLVLRRALAGAALVWLVAIAGAILLAAGAGPFGADLWVLAILVAADGLGLAGLAATTHDVSGDRTDPLGRFGAVVVFAGAILMASGATVIMVSLARALWRIVSQGDPIDRLPWGLVALIIVIPLITFTVASLSTRLAAGGTFYAQAAANRRNSLLLLISLIGIVAATAGIITVSLTFDPIPALWAAGIAILAGLGAAAGANRFGASLILETSGAKPADPVTDAVLLNVVQEVSLAANIPVPAAYIVTDGSQNAFATGRDPDHAAVVVTSGLLQAMDREELQGVIGHELGHIRNLDTRYALYIAVLVGLVALVTDGFLRIIIEGWRNGAFVWKSDDKSAAATLAMGLLVGTFLLIVAVLLRLFAPLFSALVQASTSREREFLADATSVEFTRNPRALERALASLAGDHDTLEAANRGTQHLWFRNPVKEGSDRRASLLSTHPSLAARIDRLRALEGLGPLDSDAEAAASES